MAMDATEKLTEEIALAINEMTPEQWAELGQRRHGPGLQRRALQDTARVLPILTERVRVAQKSAWDEGGAHVEGRGGYYDPEDNPYGDLDGVMAGNPSKIIV